MLLEPLVVGIKQVYGWWKGFLLSGTGRRHPTILIYLRYQNQSIVLFLLVKARLRFVVCPRAFSKSVGR